MQDVSKDTDISLSSCKDWIWTRLKACTYTFKGKSNPYILIGQVAHNMPAALFSGRHVLIRHGILYSEPSQGDLPPHFSPISPWQIVAVWEPADTLPQGLSTAKALQCPWHLRQTKIRCQRNFWPIAAAGLVHLAHSKPYIAKQGHKFRDCSA